MKKRKITVKIDSTLKYLSLWNGIFNLTTKEIQILSSFIDINLVRGEDNICSVINKKDVVVNMIVDTSLVTGDFAPATANETPALVVYGANTA